jgi:hypothetical protein
MRLIDSMVVATAPVEPTMKAAAEGYLAGQYAVQGNSCLQEEPK